MTTNKTPIYLFSVDLEDIRFRMTNGLRHSERVRQNIERILAFLRAVDARTTFFACGDVARAFPSLIRQIVTEGHEIGCHTDTHAALDSLSPTQFREDIRRNLDALYNAGASSITGFRAPYFSLVESTSWAYETLGELGFEYSSSVLPASSPAYGWRGFSEKPVWVGPVLEMPMTLTSIGIAKIPFAGGIYIRLLPRPLVGMLARRAFRAREDILGYIHPYDIDADQERFLHPGLENSAIQNRLIYYNRNSVFSKLKTILSAGYRICPYIDYVNALSERRGGKAELLRHPHV